MPFHVNVWVEDQCLAEHLRGIVRIRIWHLHVEGEVPPCVKAVIRTDLDLEVHEVLLAVVKDDLDALLFLELADVFLHANQAGCDFALSRPGRRRRLLLLLLQTEQFDHGDF